MKLHEFMAVYNGNACISIEGYCREKRYDYYLKPSPVTEDFKGNNTNRYVPTCLAMEKLKIEKLVAFP